MEPGQQGGHGSRVAHVDAVGSSSSSDEGQAQFDQAAGSGGLLLLQLQEME